jgi:hypothetical protein
MTTTKRPDWVEQTLGKYVSKRVNGPTLPSLGRNVQAEITRIQAVIDVVTKHQIPETEIVRLRNKTRDLLNILEAR